MKKIFIIIGIISITNFCFAQNKIKDSVFVKINQLKPRILSYQVDQGHLIGMNVFIKNKYGNTSGFILADGNSDLALKNKCEVSKNVISYTKFNLMLDKDFRDIWAYTKVYFVLSESKNDYLVICVRPILPGQLDIQ